MNDLEELVPPIEPGPGDCCGSGCARCVWDVYFDATAEYEQKLKSRRTTNATATTGTNDAASMPLTTPASAASTASQHCFAGGVVVKYVEPDESECIDIAKHLAGSGLTPLKHGSTTVVRSSSGDASLAVVRLNFGGQVLLPDAHHPGDVVEVLRGNDPAEVTKVLARLGVPGDRVLELLQSPFVPPNCFPPWLPRGTAISAATLLQWFTDISSTALLRRPLFELLAKHSKDDAERAELQRIVALPTPRELQATVLGTAFPSLSCILAAFPKSSPPLARVLEQLPPLRPRKFSVAGVSDDGGAIDVVVRVAAAPRIASESLSPFVARATDFSSPFVGHVSPHFILGSTLMWRRIAPGKCDLRVPTPQPLVLVAGGAGYGPLRFVLQQRHRAALSAAAKVAPATLFFGCRSSTELLFDEEWATWARDGVLDGVFPAISRDTEGAAARGGCPRHVTDAISSHSARVLRTLCSDNGALLACGPQSMLDSLRTTLVRLVGDKLGGEGTAIGEAWWSDAVASRRIIFDSWAGGAQQ